jgi:hypothetical protein
MTLGCLTLSIRYQTDLLMGLLYEYTYPTLIYVLQLLILANLLSDLRYGLLLHPYVT